MRCGLLPHRLFVSPLITVLGRAIVTSSFLSPSLSFPINRSKLLIIQATLCLLITIKSWRGRCFVFFFNALRQRKKISCRIVRIWEGVVKDGPTLDDSLASLDSSAVEWRTGPEMNMDEMNERSNAKASPQAFALVRTKHAAFSHVRQKASSMIYSECNVYIGSHFGQAVAWTAVQGKLSFHHSTKIRCMFVVLKHKCYATQLWICNLVCI